MMQTKGFEPCLTRAFGAVPSFALVRRANVARLIGGQGCTFCKTVQQFGIAFRRKLTWFKIRLVENPKNKIEIREEISTGPTFGEKKSGSYSADLWFADLILCHRTLS